MRIAPPTPMLNGRLTTSAVPVGADDVGRAVGGAVVDDEDVEVGHVLAQLREDLRQRLGLVPRRDDHEGTVGAGSVHDR